MSSMCTKCINFYVSRNSFFYKSVALLICFSNLIYMYFHQGFKKKEIKKDIFSFLKKIFQRLEYIFCLCMEMLL